MNQRSHHTDFPLVSPRCETLTHALVLKHQHALHIYQGLPTSLSRNDMQSGLSSNAYFRSVIVPMRIKIN